MKKYLFSFLSLLIVFSFILLSCGEADKDDDSDTTVTSSYTIPYTDINWATFGQYKASLHVHSWNSDGSNSQADMIEEYYGLDFDILAFTEHNYGRNASQTAGTDMLTFPYTKDWVSHNRHTEGTVRREFSLTPERYAEISTGVGRDGKKLLRVPNTSEIAVYPDEANFFFFQHTWEASVPGGVIGGAHIRNPIGLHALFSVVEDYVDPDTKLRAIGFINHPGRTTGGAGRNNQRGIDSSKERGWVNLYTSIFNNYSSCLGFEIVNRGQDNDSLNDRILWDSVLKQVIPNGKRNIWGFANDDAHSVSAAGHAWNVFIMKENTVEAFHEAMLKGNFYAVSRRAHRELGTNYYGGRGVTSSNSPPAAHLEEWPEITNISIMGQGSNNVRIILATKNDHTVNWISDGEIILGEDNQPVNVKNFRLSDYGDQIGSYVRANIMGVGGIAFTQPFPVEELRGN